jgi:molecular chaperone GrpE
MKSREEPDKSPTNEEKESEKMTNNPFFSKKMKEKIDSSAEENVNQQENSENIEYIRKLEGERETLTREHETLKNQYVRLAADFDNYRKRQDQVKQELYNSGAADVITALIPVLDTLDRAYLSFKTLDDSEKLKESFDVLYRQMQDSLTKMQVSKIKTAGELFDPNFHQAVMQEETTEFEDNTISAELQCGYILNDRVLRAAMVKVASNPEGVQNQENKQTNHNDQQDECSES